MKRIERSKLFVKGVQLNGVGLRLVDRFAPNIRFKVKCDFRHKLVSLPSVQEYNELHSWLLGNAIRGLPSSTPRKYYTWLRQYVRFAGRGRVSLFVNLQGIAPPGHIQDQVVRDSNYLFAEILQSAKDTKFLASAKGWSGCVQQRLFCHNRLADSSSYVGMVRKGRGADALSAQFHSYGRWWAMRAVRSSANTWLLCVNNYCLEFGTSNTLQVEFANFDQLCKVFYKISRGEWSVLFIRELCGLVPFKEGSEKEGMEAMRLDGRGGCGCGRFHSLSKFINFEKYIPTIRGITEPDMQVALAEQEVKKQAWKKVAEAT